MFKLIFPLLFSSVLVATESPTGPSHAKPLNKYKTIKEEVNDRKATVKTTDAIIFADVGLKYPVHKVKQGQVLYLAAFEVKFENVFAVLINGGVAYIRAGDIEIQKVFSSQSSPKLKSHNIDYQFEEMPTRRQGRSNILARYVSFTPGTRWADFNKSANDTAAPITGLQLLVEFHPKDNFFGFGIGSSYYSTNQSKVDMNAWVFEGQMNFSPLKAELVALDFNLGAGFSSGLKIEMQGVEGINSGYFYSWNIGVALRFFPEYKIGGVLGLNYRSWNISGMKRVIFSDGGQADLNGFSGSDLFFGLSYKF